MNRVASFRQAPGNYHHRFSFVRLSEAGFSYTGESSFVQCQGCGKKVSMDEMVNDGEIISPNDVKFHNSICEFVDKVRAEMENCRGSNLDSGKMMFFPNHTCLQLNVCRGFSHSNGKHHREQQSVMQTSSSSSETFVYDESQDVDYEIQIKNPQSTQNDMKCSKNPGHFGYFPVSDLKMDHLPGLSRNPYVLKILQLLALMTVKINVKMCNTSGCYHQSGTGFVLLETGESPTNKNVALSACNGTNISCGMCRDNSFSDTDNEVYIITSRRLVTCSPDPGNITVDFCCDELLSGQSITIEVASIHPMTNNNESILVCRPKDVAFVQKIHHIRSQILELVGNIPDSVKDFLSKKVFLIHHPHGKDKVLSHGDFVQVNYTLVADDKTRTLTLHKMSRTESVNAEDLKNSRKILMYTADTCLGSTGAPVITFTQMSPSGHFYLDIWMHVGQHKTHGLGCSAMKALQQWDLDTVKNCASQDTSKNATDETASSNEHARDSLGQSPVAPSYPAFVTREKRLETFSNWSHQHIHQPEYLASIGFFYAGYSDCVRCFQCGLGLRSWRPGDNVLEEHKRLRGTCPFLQKLLDNVTR